MNKQTLVQIDATYSPEDNKIRLYASERLPADLYARVKAAGTSVNTVLFTMGAAS